MPLYSFSLFLPTILAGMGYAGTHAQLLSVPPYAVAAALTILVGWFADKTRWRGYCNMVTVSIGLIGFSMLIGSQNPKIKYAGTFLGAAGIYPTIPNTLTWASNNVEGVYKRGVIIGIVVGVGNLQGVVSRELSHCVSWISLTHPTGQQQYFPGHREAPLSNRSRHCLGISRILLAWRNYPDAFIAAKREQTATQWAKRQYARGQDRGRDLGCGRQPSRFYLHNLSRYLVTIESLQYMSGIMTCVRRASQINAQVLSSCHLAQFEGLNTNFRCFAYFCLWYFPGTTTTGNTRTDRSFITERDPKA